MPIITTNILYTQTTDHLESLWRSIPNTQNAMGLSTVSTQGYLKIPIDDRIKWIKSTVMPTFSCQTMKAFPERPIGLRPTTAEVLAVPTYAAQLGISPFGIFR
jgi:hypothetical protein